MNTMTITAPKAKREPVAINGVNTPVLLATINAVAGQPDLARFTFRAANTWQDGTHSQSRIEGFYGAGGEHAHSTTFVANADHPGVLIGADNGPTPVEWLLHALASCLTAGIGNIAAARGIKLHHVTSRVEGDIDLRGILGISDEVRNGFHEIRITYDIAADASAEDIEKLLLQSRARSAVFDVLTNGTRVSVGMTPTVAA